MSVLAILPPVVRNFSHDTSQTNEKAGEMKRLPPTVGFLPERTTELTVAGQGNMPPLEMLILPEELIFKHQFIAEATCCQHLLLALTPERPHDLLSKNQ
jgi:hypothetical protein